MNQSVVRWDKGPVTISVVNRSLAEYLPVAEAKAMNTFVPGERIQLQFSGVC